MRDSFYKLGEEEPKEVKFDVEQRLGQGGYGTVSKISAGVGSKIRGFALKEYGGQHGTREAWAAFSAYNALKKAGLKVLPTFRISEDRKKVLMTLHDPEKVYTVDGKPRYKGLDLVEPPEEDKVHEIQNFDALIDNFFKQSVLAAEAGIGFELDDIFHFTIDRETKTKVDFFVQDLDLIALPMHTMSAAEKHEILKKNLNSSKSSVDFFLATHVKGDKREEYIDIVNRKYQKLLSHKT